MADKLIISRAVVVEGKYDKIKLSSIIDALIVETNGFRIFKDESKKRYIKKLALERGLLIITDSDSAGFLIRNHLKSFIDDSLIENIYIPRVPGKERRKEKPGAEGILGLEGLDNKLIIKAITDSDIVNKSSDNRRIYKTVDLFNMGLTGENSKEKRGRLLELLSLPDYINNSALLKYMNTANVTLVNEALRKINE